MPVKAHVNNDLDYSRSSTHHDWKQESHHDFNNHNGHVLAFFGLGALIVVLLIVLSMTV